MSGDRAQRDTTWRRYAQCLLDDGLLAADVARSLGKDPRTLHTLIRDGTLRRKVAWSAYRPFPDPLTCRRCGRVAPHSDFIWRLASTPPVLKRDYPIHCRWCRVEANGRLRAKTLARGGRKVVWRTAQEKAQLAEEAARLGVTVIALLRRRSLDADPVRKEAHRLKSQIAQHVHHEARKDWPRIRDQRMASQSDGTLTRDVVRHLFGITDECPYCGIPLTGDTKALDHMRPLTLGGMHSVANVLICCRRCNKAKNAKPFDVWLRLIPEDLAARFRTAA